MSTMKITRIDCTPYTLPARDNGVRFALGRLTATENVLVEVHTDEGLIGRAEAPSRPFFYGESQRSMVAAVERWFAPALTGLDPFALERVWEVFGRIEHNNTAKGAIDIALHDVIGQALGQPCARLLGGYADSLAVTYICGYADPGIMRDEALAVRERYGIETFKLKVGIDPAQDREMLRTLRTALPGSRLYVDGNQGLKAHDALEVLAACREYGILWAEEPCHMHDRAGRRLVARRGGVPIMGDESCRIPEEIAREIDDDAIHLVSIKVARTGFRVSRDILAQCSARRIRTVIGSQGDSGLGVLAGLHFGAAHRSTACEPAELTFFLNLAGDLLAETPPVVAGRMSVPNVPGLGVRLDAGRLARYRVD